MSPRSYSGEAQARSRNRLEPLSRVSEYRFFAFCKYLTNKGGTAKQSFRPLDGGFLYF